MEVERGGYVPPTPGAGDTAHTVAKAVISAVPWIGGPAAEVFGMILAPPISKRRDEWMETMADGLRDLEDMIEGFSIESLSANDSFVTTLMDASQMAIRNHQQEKLDALRNAVLNSALPNAPLDDIQAMFLSAVDGFTILHVRALKLLAEHSPWYYMENVKLQEDRSAMGLEHYFPELQQHPGLSGMVMQDMFTHGFVNELSVRRDVAFSREQRKLGRLKSIRSVVMPLGRQFLAFITEPKAMTE